MEKVEILNINFSGVNILLIDNPALVDKVENDGKYYKLGKLKNIDSEAIIGEIKGEFIPQLNCFSYKNYYPIEDSEVYSKSFLLLKINSLVSFFLSRKIVISHYLAPEFVEEIKNDMEVIMDNPSLFTLK